jgi:hypothetical protein
MFAYLSNAKTYVPTAVLAWIIKSNENPDGFGD